MLTGQDSVRNERPVCGDKGSERWHLRDLELFSCESQGGAVGGHRGSRPRLDIQAMRTAEQGPGPSTTIS
jgi:hypothetical protein